MVYNALIKFLVLYCLILLSFQLRAQVVPESPKPIPPPILTREISGIVKDIADNSIPYVSVQLVSVKDTLSGMTNENGIFKFINVRSATYTLTIKGIGFKLFVGKFKQSDAVPRIVMDPILLEVDTYGVDQVVINGRPPIVYKTDTIEYTASNYIVRINATIDELLKKMEGMDVSKNGTLLHQGTEITKAKLNGKTFLGGDVASTIQNLPAEIVEKIQIVDDYGDQAARTGIKSGDPEKILNIVTRPDKSVGNMANIEGGVGNNNRYEGAIFATRINGDRTIGLYSTLNNTIIGIGSSKAGNNGNTSAGGFDRVSSINSGNSEDGTIGITRNGNASFSFRDDLSSKVKINTDYSYNVNNTDGANSSITQLFSSLGTTLSSDESLSNHDSKTHKVSFELEADLDKYNFLRFAPTFNYSSAGDGSNSVVMQTGLIHQDLITKDMRSNKRPTVGTTVFYQHLFKKPRRNLSLQINLNNSNQESERERNSNIFYYQNNSDLVLKDSLIHRLLVSKNLTKNYRGSMTFAEPINANTQFEFNGQINYNGYNNNATTRNILIDGRSHVIDSLTNIYDYSFTHTRLSINYRFGVEFESKIKFSLGVTAITTFLTGKNLNFDNTTHRNSFNLVPIARFQYVWSRTQNVQVNYSGIAIAPTFEQIQPVRDVSNPQNPIIGNPNLKATFNHSINTSYNNYIANSMLNISVNMNATIMQNSVSRNTVQIPDAFNSLKNETRFVNSDGVYSINGNYFISKQLNNRKYNLAYSGNIVHYHGISISNNLQNITTTWNFSQRFGPKINPADWLEVNPSISYTLLKSNNTLPTSIDSKTKTFALNVDGRIFLWNGFVFGYDASKNYVSGINTSVADNPFIINSYLKKDLWERKISISLQAFDILNQNKFINRDITDESITDTRSNVLSRYFMLHISAKLQKWTSYKPKSGRPINRRGDGSFN